MLICRKHGVRSWEIDTWLMSCRVLGRKVEWAILNELLTQARLAGIDSLIGTYRPTEKNHLVRDHYQKLGFVKIEDAAEGGTVWQLRTSTQNADVPIKISASWPVPA